MLKVANLHNLIWVEAIATTSSLQNLSLTKVLANSTSYQFWIRIQLDLSHLIVFGYLAYTHIQDQKDKKLNIKSLKCIFIGYREPNGVKGYQLLISIQLLNKILRLELLNVKTVELGNRQNSIMIISTPMPLSLTLVNQAL